MNLTAAEIAKIEQAASHGPDKSAAAIDALLLVQAGRGWITDEILQDIAAVLGMSGAELDSVATFYNRIYRRPVGKKVIHYCDSVCCWMLGAEDNRAYLETRLGIGLGETTADGGHTLLPIACLGACDRAPVLLIGEDTHFNVDPGKLAALLERT